MAGSEDNRQTPPDRSAEPRGFGEHTRGLASEYAHEQGWGLDEEERTKQETSPQDIDGGGDYEYGVRDFGDEPVNTEIPPDAKERTQNNAGERDVEEQKES